MRLPRKKKKELKKAFDTLSAIDAIHAKAHILLSISRLHLKNLKSYPIKFGYGRIGINHLGEELDSFSVEVPINQQQNEQ